MLQYKNHTSHSRVKNTDLNKNKSTLQIYQNTFSRLQFSAPDKEESELWEAPR